MPKQIVRLVLSFFFSFFLISCGGGGSNSSTSPGNDVKQQPVVTYTVTVSSDIGSNISPTYALVESGKNAVFNVTSLPGYTLKSVTGAGGTLIGNVYTTGPITANASITVTTESAKDKYTIQTMRMTPRAVFDDEFKTTPITIEVTASGKNFTLYARHFTNWFDRSLPVEIIEEQLFDDGTHGDKVSGDGIYTRIIVPGITPVLRYHDKTVDQFSYGIVAKDSVGNYLNPSNYINTTLLLGVVSRSESVSTTQISGDIFAAPNMVNVVMPDYVTQVDYLSLATKKIYNAFADLFDALVLYELGGTLGNNIPLHITVKTNVQGINQSTYDISSNYGSSGKLQQIVDQKASIIGEEFLHEFGHQWGFYLNKAELDLTYDSISGTKTAGYHIGTPTTLIGLMGNNLFLAEQSNGDFQATLAFDKGQYYGRIFSDFELYLMGLIPASDVQPHRFILDRSKKIQPFEIIPRDKTSVVTINDVIKVYGPRSPSAKDSQKSYRTLFVGISEKPMTAAEIAIINQTASYYSSTSASHGIDTSGFLDVWPPHSFNSATSGLATLNTMVPAKK